MDHSSIIYLIGSDGRFVSTITYQEKDDFGAGEAEKLALGAFPNAVWPLHTSNALALRIVDNVDATDVSRVNRGIDKSRPLPKPDQLSALWK
jgi:hypothetical protein